MQTLEQILTKWLVDKVGLQDDHLRVEQAKQVGGPRILPLFWVMWHGQSLMSVVDYKIIAVPRTTEVPYITGGEEFSIYDPQLFTKLETTAKLRIAQLQDMF